MKWIYGLLCLFFLILFHEFGHFIAAKIFGVKVEAFSIGFGPVLNQKFMSELGISANDGYNPNTDNTYDGTTLWHWLNDFGENKISIASCIDTGMRSIILPARKISRMLYLVNKDGIYHKYGYDENSHRSCGYYKYQDIKYEIKNGLLYIHLFKKEIEGDRG